RHAWRSTSPGLKPQIPVNFWSPGRLGQACRNEGYGIMTKHNAIDFQSRRVVILGLARQGLALARFFVRAGAQTLVSDAAPAEKLTAEIAELGELPVELVLGGHPLSLLDGCDLLCL